MPLSNTGSEKEQHLTKLSPGIKPVTSSIVRVHSSITQARRVGGELVASKLNDESDSDHRDDATRLATANKSFL